MNIYLVRHGETDGNVRGLYYGDLDLPMNAVGERQASSVARLLRNVTFDRVYASDLSRAVRTAEAVLQENISAKTYQESHPEIEKVPQLRELNFGIWEGLTYHEIIGKWPELFELWGREWVTTRTPEGESFGDFYERCVSGFYQILKECAEGDTKDNAKESSKESTKDIINDHTKDHANDKNILVAAHNGTFRCLLAEILGLGVEGTWHFDFEQGAYTKIEYTDGYFTVRRINSRECVPAARA